MGTATIKRTALFALIAAIFVASGFCLGGTYTKAWAAEGDAATVAGVEYPTLQAAIEAAPDGATVTLLRDINETATISGKTLTLDLATHTISGAGIVTHPDDPEGEGQTLLTLAEGANVTVKNGTMRDGTGDVYVNENSNSAGAICAHNSTLSVEGVTFTDNKELSGWGITGAAIRAAGSTLTITDCTFNTENGGDDRHAFVAALTTKLAISDSTFTGAGPALYVRDAPSEVTVTDTQIVGNESSGSTIIINMYKTTYRFTMTNCTIQNNKVSDNTKGIIFLTQEAYAWGRITLDNCTVTNNTSESGPIFASTGWYPYNILTLKDTLVANNTTIEGAIEINNKMRLVLDNSVVKNNVAKGNPGYDTCTGGIIFYSTQSNSITMTNSAIYNNVLESADPSAPGVANDMYVYKGAKNLSGFLPASEMYDFTDPDFDFSNMVWKDGKVTGSYDKIPEITDKKDCFYTVMDKSSLQVAQINDDPGKIYETLEAAFEAAEVGDTIKIIAQEQIVVVNKPIAVDKNVTLDVNDHDIRFAGGTGGTGGTPSNPLFTVASGAALTLKNTQSDDPSNKIDGGFESGTLLIEEGGSAAIDDPMRTTRITNNGELALNAVQKTVDVTLGAGKTVTLGSGYDTFNPNTQGSNGRVNVILDPAVLDALNSGTSDTVRVVDGGNANMLSVVKVEGITNGAVLKEFANNGVELRVVKAIFLKGAGSDTNSGATAEQAVQTFAKARELLEADESIDAIIICGEVPITESETWSTPDGRSVLRDVSYTGALAKVRPGGSLTLRDIVLDGLNFDARDALVNVDEGGTLNIQDGALLKNNRNSRQDFYCWGGAVASSGTTTMSGGTVEGCYAGFGGGIFQLGGTFDMTGGTIQNNRANAVYVSSSTDERPGAGGGVYLARGAKMTLGAPDASGGAASSTGPVIANNSARGEGGGIALGSSTHGGKGWFITYENGQPVNLGTRLDMYGGTIDGNAAGRNGGGIFVQDSMSAYLYKGNITNNTAIGGNYYFGGGGVYVNGLHTIDNGKYMNGTSLDLFAEEKDLEHGFLYIESAEITNNTANWAGGALAACNVSKTIVGDLAASVYGNTINNNATNNSKVMGENADMFLSTVGHDPNTAGLSHPPAYLSNYRLDGSDFGWANSAGKPISTDHLYYNESSMTATAANGKASGTAGVVISGNYSGTNGGGLGSNGIIVIGSIVDKVDVSVDKVWNDGDAVDTRPTELTFVLYRAEGEDGDKTEIARQVVKADEKGAFTYTWKDLLKNVPGTQTAFVYTVEEDTTAAAQDAQGNAVSIANRYTATVKQGETSSRQITRPNTSGGVDTSSQAVYNFAVENTVNPITEELEVAKSIKGTPGESEAFTFTLTPQGKAPLPDGAVDGVATLELTAAAGAADQELSGSFGVIKFEKPGTYTYTVAETKGSNNLVWTYDTSGYTVTYTVAVGDAGLEATKEITKAATPQAEAAKADAIAFENTYTPIGEPEIEKFVDKAVHKDIDVGQVFTYDIVAFVTRDAEQLTITDVLDSQLQFASAAQDVQVFDMGPANNHKPVNDVAGAAIEGNADATVALAGTPIALSVAGEDSGQNANANAGNRTVLSIGPAQGDADAQSAGGEGAGSTSNTDGEGEGTSSTPAAPVATPTISDNTLTVVIDNAASLRGNWVKVTFQAKIADALAQRIKAHEPVESVLGYTTIQASQVEAGRSVPNVGNQPVASEQDHSGVPNKAHYAIGVPNGEGEVAYPSDEEQGQPDSPHADTSNTVTVNPGQPTPPSPPDNPTIKVSKVTVADAETELEGATLAIRDGEGTTVDTWTSTSTVHEVQLAPGTYTLVELEAPFGYKVADPISFAVTETGLAEGEKVTMVDEPEVTLEEHKGADAATIHKAWYNDQNIAEYVPIEFVAQYLFKGDDPADEANWHTTDKSVTVTGTAMDHDGLWTAHLEGLPAFVNGQEVEWRAIESELNGYERAITTIAGPGGMIAANLPNNPNPIAAVEVSKYVDGTSQLLEGAVLQILKDGEVVQEWTSGTTTYRTTLEVGSYVLHEKSAPKGYQVAEDVPFTVSDGDTVNFAAGETFDPTQALEVKMYDKPETPPKDPDPKDSEDPTPGEDETPKKNPPSDDTPKTKTPGTTPNTPTTSYTPRSSSVASGVAKTADEFPTTALLDLAALAGAAAIALAFTARRLRA